MDQGLQLANALMEWKPANCVSLIPNTRTFGWEGEIAAEPCLISQE